MENPWLNGTAQIVKERLTRHFSRAQRKTPGGFRGQPGVPVMLPSLRKASGTAQGLPRIYEKTLCHAVALRFKRIRILLNAVIERQTST